LTVVVGAGTVVGYQNGVQIASPVAFSNPLDVSGFLYLGGNGNYAPASAIYDDMRVFDRALTSSQVQSIYNQQGMPGRGTMFSNDRQIYVAPVGTYPSYTPTSGAQFPVFNTSNVSFYSSGGTSGGTVGQYLAFGSQTFNMSRGFSAVCQFAWTNGIGVWERIFDFGNGASNNNILLTRTGTSTNLLFSYRIGSTEYSVTAVGSIPAQNTLYTVVAIYDPSKPLLSLYVNGTLTSSIPAVVAHDTRTLTQTYIGRSNWGSDAYSNVNVNYLSVYNRILTADEINSPLPTPQITLKGAPLFTQLSPSAASSAVGAFSLRAVNGVSTRAVNVAPGGTFPPSPFTSASIQNVNQYTQTLSGYPFSGSYVANTSTVYNSTLVGWKAFSQQYAVNQVWASTAGGYSSSSPYQYIGGVTTTDTLTNPYSGEWIQLQSPSPVILTSYSITNGADYGATVGQSPKNWWVFGSSTGLNGSWTLVDTRAGITWAGTLSQTQTFTPSTQTASYLYFRVIVNQVSGYNVGVVQLSGVRFFGTVPSLAQDFYADERGNLLTAPVTGTTLQNWLGGATGYVTKWYDQSGTNHAIQDTAANQPIIQRATKGSGYMVNFNGTSQFVTLSASYNFLNGTNITVNAVALRTATVTSPNYIIGTNSPTVSYQRFFLGFASDTSILMPVTGAPTSITIPAYNASNEPVTYMTGGLTPSRVLYKNDTLGGTNVDTTLLSVPSGYSYSIGYTVGAATYYYQGNLFELLIFNSALNQAQVTQIYNNQLGYTGT
jgi:hypothetical protein